MKFVSFIGGLLVLSTSAFAGPPTSAPATTYILGNDTNPNLTKDPTADQIKAAVAQLDGDKTVAVIVTADHGRCVQVNWEAPKQFSFQYTERLAMFDSRGKQYSADAAVKLLTAFINGGEDWKKLADWQKD